MLTTLAIANYRSLRNLVVTLGSLNVVTGASAKAPQPQGVSARLTGSGTVATGANQLAPNDAL